MDNKLVEAVLSFSGTKKKNEKLDMWPLIPAFALMRYMRHPITDIHEFAKEQGYEGGYNAFTKWLKRNVDFEAECAKYAEEFKAILAGDRAITKQATSEKEVFARRTQREKKEPSTAKRKAEPSVSDPPKEAERQLTPEEAYKKWAPLSYEDRLKNLGLDKGENDDENGSS